jgi:type II secretory pathway component PulL
MRSMPSTFNSSTSKSTAVLAVPTAHLSLLEVMLPPTPLHRLPLALAGALEDQLLDDPADLHMAVAPDAAAAMKAGRAFGLMVCNKAWLSALVARQQAQGAVVQRIVPADASLQASGWDLAQFDFAPKAAWLAKVQRGLAALCLGREWRAARVAIVLLVLVQLVGVNLWAWRDRAALAEKRSQVNQVLMTAFPQTQVVVDAPVQMAKGVAALRTSSGALGAKDLESLLAQQTAPLGLAQIDFAGGELKVVTKMDAKPEARVAP